VRDVSSEWLEKHHTRWCFREDAPKLAATGRSFVINLDDKDGMGTHWTAARKVGDTLFYADPFGTILSGYPPRELEQTSGRSVINRIAWQRPETNLCGYYAHLFTKALDKASEKWDAKRLEHELWESIN
jgi:hypothetical protein